MTRKDFELIARVIRQTRDVSTEDSPEFIEGQLTMNDAVAQALAAELWATNERFDADRFRKACGVTS
jgi:hypothetical protein